MSELLGSAPPGWARDPKAVGELWACTFVRVVSVDELSRITC